MTRLMVIGVLLSLCGAMIVGCENDLCQNQPPAIELSLDPAAGLDLSAVDAVRVTFGGLPLGSHGVTPKKLAKRPMTVKLVFAEATGDGGPPPLPLGLDISLTVELWAGKQVVAIGKSEPFAPSIDACNFISVPLGAPSATPDAGAPDAGASDTGAPDTGAPDTGAPDAGAPDTGAPDSGIDAVPGPG